MKHPNQLTIYEASSSFFSPDPVSAMGHTSTVVSMDEQLGIPLIVRDANNHEVRTEYDGFGRVKKQVAPTGVETHTEYRWAEAGDPAGTVYKVITHSKKGGTIFPSAIAFYDKAIRVIQTEGTSFDGRVICQETRYNSKGQKWHVSKPYFKGTSPMFTTFEYDVLGRSTKVTMPDNTFATWSYTGRKTIATNPAEGNGVKGNGVRR